MKIEVDREKCTECGLCIRDCVSGVVREVAGKPVYAEPQLCSRCGHCVAVCPVGAVTHDGLDMGEVRRTKKKIVTPEAFAETVKGRRSVRHYKEEPVSREILDQIIDLARYSPTASNTQNVQYVVVTDRQVIQKAAKRIWSVCRAAYGATEKFPLRLVYQTLRRINPENRLLGYSQTMDYYLEESAKGRDFILHHAPVLFLVLTPKGEAFACDNANIAATNITNYAHSLGLGTCYTGFMTLFLRYDPGLRKLLKVPKGQTAHATFVLGHPAYKHSKIPSRKKPRVRYV